MPDSIDSTLIITILSAVGTFAVVLGIALALLKRSEKKKASDRNEQEGADIFDIDDYIRQSRWARGKKVVLSPFKRIALAVSLFRVRHRREILFALYFVAVLGVWFYFSHSGDGELITCHSPYIFDGDTLKCGGKRIRLEGIDAPEMPGHCRPGRKCTEGDPFASRDYLKSLSRGKVECRPIEKDHYGRTIARCEAGEEDLSCAMIDAGHAVRRYGNILCL